MPRHFIQDPSQLGPVLDAIASADLLCIDTEFHAERRFEPELCLVQIHIPDGDTWLLDARVDGLVEVLDRAADLPWLMHAPQQDLPLLYARWHRLTDTLLDVQTAAGLVSPAYPSSFGSLLEDWCDIPVDKGAQLSNWKQRPLSDKQKDYAAQDVELLVPVWRALRAELHTHARYQWLVAAGAQMLDQVVNPAPDDLSYLQLGRTTTLNRQQFSIVQELCHWRLQQARTSNQPAKSVLSDGLVMHIAKLAPCSVDALRESRRIPKSVTQKYGEAIVDRVLRASSRPDWAHPHVIPRHSALHLELLALEACLAVWAVDNHLAPKLVAPKTLLEAILVKEEPKHFAYPWLEPVVRELRAGDRVLRWSNGSPHVA